MLFAFNQNSCAVFSNVEQKGLRRVECDTKKKNSFVWAHITWITNNSFLDGQPTNMTSIEGNPVAKLFLFSFTTHVDYHAHCIQITCGSPEQLLSPQSAEMSISHIAAVTISNMCKMKNDKVHVTLCSRRPSTRTTSRNLGWHWDRRYPRHIHLWIHTASNHAKMDENERESQKMSKQYCQGQYRCQ